MILAKMPNNQRLPKTMDTGVAPAIALELPYGQKLIASVLIAGDPILSLNTIPPVLWKSVAKAGGILVLFSPVQPKHGWQQRPSNIERFDSVSDLK